MPSNGSRKWRRAPARRWAEGSRWPAFRRDVKTARTAQGAGDARRRALVCTLAGPTSTPGPGAAEHPRTAPARHLDGNWTLVHLGARNSAGRPPLRAATRLVDAPSRSPGRALDVALATPCTASTVRRETLAGGAAGPPHCTSTTAGRVTTAPVGTHPATRGSDGRPGRVTTVTRPRGGRDSGRNASAGCSATRRERRGRGRRARERWAAVRTGLRRRRAARRGDGSGAARLPHHKHEPASRFRDVGPLSAALTRSPPSVTPWSPRP